MKMSLVGKSSAAFHSAKYLRAMVESGVAQAAQAVNDAPASRSDDDDGEDAF